jgi:hypothetical protein
MRSTNPETGKPFPRNRPVDWAAVARIRAYRSEHRRMAAAGYVEREILHPQLGSHMGLRVVAATPSADGRHVFVKIVDQNGEVVRSAFNPQDARAAEQQRAWVQQQSRPALIIPFSHERENRSTFWPF